MIDTQSLKNKILDLAIRGKLTRQLPEDGTAEELYEKIQEEKQALVEGGKIKKEKPLNEIEEGEVPFEIPESWKWVKLSEISYLTSGGQYEETKEGVPYVKVADMNSSENQHEIIKSTRYVDKCNIGIIPKGSIIFPKRGGAIATNKKRLVNETEIYVDTNIMGMTIIYPPTMSYIKIWFDSIDLGMLQSGTSIPQINNKDLYPLLIPLPPLAEQKRIVEIVEKLFVEIDTIEKLQSQYAADAEILKSKLIDAAIQGKLTEQLPSDGTAEELYRQIQEEKKALIESGKIKKEKPLKEIEEDEISFEIPESWKWVRFGDISYIERGGSPRPIKQYLTDDANGINWIKIGDVEKGGKYIFKTKEKIKPEGEKKSRRVYPDDFLLTNSMSFGRPYISKIEGCVHDGWLIIRNLGGFSADYLYYLLSAKFLYEQFCQKASGSTVSNLNIEKVNSAIIPLPPIKEQERIANRIEELLKECN